MIMQPVILSPLSTFANSEDPDEMQLDSAFHLDLHCLNCKGKKIFRQKNTIFF